MGKDHWHSYYGCSNCGRVYEFDNMEKNAQRPCPRCHTKNYPFDEVSDIVYLSTLNKT